MFELVLPDEARRRHDILEVVGRDRSQHVTSAWTIAEDHPSEVRDLPASEPDRRYERGNALFGRVTSGEHDKRTRGLGPRRLHRADILALEHRELGG